MVRRILSIAVLAGSLAGSLAAVGCAGKSVQPDPTAQTASPEERVPFLDVALETAELRPDQKKNLEALRAELSEARKPVTKELKALGALLATALEKGVFDRPAVDAQLAKVKAASDALQPKVAEAIVKVHALLDENQRKAVVAAIRDKRQHRAGGFAHGFKGVLRDLDLTDTQKQTLKSALHGDHALEGHAHLHAMKAVADAFESDAFDAKALEPLQGKSAAAFADKAARFVEAALPVLDVSQRQKLASAIRARIDG